MEKSLIHLISHNFSVYICIQSSEPSMEGIGSIPLHLSKQLLTLYFGLMRSGIGNRNSCQINGMREKRKGRIISCEMCIASCECVRGDYHY